MPTEIVIIGAGIIGLSTALYVLESPDRPPDARVTLIEAVSIASGASGRAGGFITFNSAWHRPAVSSLAALSAANWAKLVERFNGKESFGYQDVETRSLFVGTEDTETLDAETSSYYDDSGPGGGPGTTWHNGEVVEMGHGARSSLILPHLLCSRVYQHCAQKGLRTVIATPTSRTGKVLHLSTGEDIAYDVLAITAGPWCSDVCRALGFPEVAVAGGPGHFLQVQPGYIPGGLREVPSQALFVGIGETVEEASENLAALDATRWATRLTDHERRHGLATTLEVFPRADGKVYIAGENHLQAATANFPERKFGLPPNPCDVAEQVDRLLSERLKRTVKFISPALDVDNGARVVREDIAFRPITPDRLPIVGQIAESVFACGGHGPWGVTLAPGSGQVMAELVVASLLGKEPVLSADISSLNPGRFTAVEIRQWNQHDPARDQ